MDTGDRRDVGDFRKLLGEYGKELSDDEVERIRDLEYELADAIFHWWLRRRKVAANAESPHNVETEDAPAGDAPVSP